MADVTKQPTTGVEPVISEKQPGVAIEQTTEAKPLPNAEEAHATSSADAPTEALEKLDLAEKTEANPTPAGALADSASGPPQVQSSGPTWPDTPADHPLTKLFESIDDLVKETGHDEIYGVKLSKSSPFQTKLILQKFLRANQGDLEKGKLQLIETLKWRKEFDPIKAAGETFEQDRFDGLGYILQVGGVPESVNEKDIVTFNIYGAVKDNKKTFGDLSGFIRWRVALMERSVQKLNLASATKPIPNFGEGIDPYQGFQVHDYLQVSFLRQDPVVKAATKETIGVLSRYYPETLSRKFFVNVPVVMGWLYQATKLLIAKETAKKFTVLSYGNALATELGPRIPKEYGGNAGALWEMGEGMKLEEKKVEETK